MQNSKLPLAALTTNVASRNVNHMPIAFSSHITIAKLALDERNVALRRGFFTVALHIYYNIIILNH